MQAITKLVTHGRTELAKVIVGQSDLIDGTLTALLCGGHALIEGVPGLGKTLSVKVLARALNVTFQRVQCTSDLMPADLLGSNILNLQTGTFSLHQGPMFTDLLLVDEVNRMPPRTQASLLESMEERQVTIDGIRHSLSQLFTVLATQNPGGVRRHLPTARGATGSFSVEDQDWISIGARGNGNPRQTQ